MDAYASLIKLISYPIQVDINAMPDIGAAVASTINESFSLETFILSVTGLIIGPTISELA